VRTVLHQLPCPVAGPLSIPFGRHQRKSKRKTVKVVDVPHGRAYVCFV
jgi:hypothetical protein